MMLEVRLVYKDRQIINQGKENEEDTPVFLNIHLKAEHLKDFMKSIEEKKAYWLEDDKGAFWTNPDLLRTVQAFPIMEKTDEPDRKATDDDVPQNNESVSPPEDKDS